MPLRITYVVHQFLPKYFTGTEQYVFAVAKAMQQRGHDVEVYCLDPDFAEREPFYEENREVVEGLPVVRFRHWMHLGRDFQRLEYHHPYVGLRFSDYLKARQPDVVHAFHLRHLGANLLSETAALGIPTVVHLMDFWFLCPRVVLMRGDGSLCEGPPDEGYGCIECMVPPLAKRIADDGLEAEVRANMQRPSPSTPGKTPIARASTFAERPRYLRDQWLRASRVVAPSRFLRDIFVRNGYPTERIDVIGYGVDRARLGSLANGRPTRPDGAPLRVGFFGSIAEHKGVDLLVDAVMQVPGDLTLSIFGRTTDFAEFAQPLAERASGDPRIAFREPFPREKLGDALTEIDVLVVPSRWYENTPFVVLEAFAGGVPVIATDLGGTAELIEDGVWSDLFARGDAASLAAKIRAFVDDSSQLARYRNALPPIKTLDANIDEMLALYESLS